MNWTQSGTTTPILAAVSYSGPAGAFGAITSANVGQSAGAALYHYAAQLDSDGRLVADDLVKINTGAMLYDEQVHYDPVGNVSAVTTILPAGTDHQLFCYDEQNRLTWAGTTSGNPCGNSAATGSFGGASYTQSFGYDTLNRLTSGPLGSYTYGDSAHLHAATSVSSGYTASYDAAGDMQCRAPSGSTTCSGTPTGQQLTWDVEGRLSNWQNATTNPTVTAKYLYDGEGNRVVQQVVDSTAGSTTTTSYVGSLETYSVTTSSGPTAITTTDYIPAGKVLAESVNGTLSYLATSYQGSVVAALDSTGAVGVTASHLYAPYGGVRYSSGALPTDYGYTGQRADASTGLDYYGARYYDPTLGQFTSADTVLAGGLNRYGYVGGNPTTGTDPTGHVVIIEPSEDVQGRPAPDPNTNGNGSEGGGGGLPPINLWPLIKGIGAWVGTIGTDISEAVSVPTALAPGYTASPTGNDELTRALHQPGPASLDDMPYWNQVSANRYKAAHPSPTTPTTTPTPPPGPQTQTGGGGAGAPPGGGQPPSVANPVPGDDDCGCDIVDVYLSMSKYPETAQHILDAINAGHPDILTLDRGLASANRAASLRGIPTKPGFDRDEYPMAATREGGAGADVRYVTSADNQGAGSSIGNQLRPYDDGQRFRIVICP